MNDKEIINDLLHHLYIALPFVEDAEHDESYKPNWCEKYMPLIPF